MCRDSSVALVTYYRLHGPTIETWCRRCDIYAPVQIRVIAGGKSAAP